MHGVSVRTAPPEAVMRRRRDPLQRVEAALIKVAKELHERNRLHRLELRQGPKDTERVVEALAHAASFARSVATPRPPPAEGSQTAYR